MNERSVREHYLAQRPNPQNHSFVIAPPPVSLPMNIGTDESFGSRELAQDETYNKNMTEQGKMYSMDNFETGNHRPEISRGNKMTKLERRLIDTAWKQVEGGMAEAEVLAGMQGRLRDRAERSFRSRKIWMEQRDIRTSISTEIKKMSNVMVDKSKMTTLDGVAWAVRRLESGTVTSPESPDPTTNWDRIGAIAVLGMAGKEETGGKKVTEIVRQIEAYKPLPSKLTDGEKRKLEVLRNKYINPNDANNENPQKPEKPKEDNKERTKTRQALSLMAVAAMSLLLLSNSGRIKTEAPALTPEGTGASAPMVSEMGYPAATEPPLPLGVEAVIRPTRPEEIFGKFQKTPIPPAKNPEAVPTTEQQNEAGTSIGSENKIDISQSWNLTFDQGIDEAWKLATDKKILWRYVAPQWDTMPVMMTSGLKDADVKKMFENIGKYPNMVQVYKTERPGTHVFYMHAGNREAGKFDQEWKEKLGIGWEEMINSRYALPAERLSMAYRELKDGIVGMKTSFSAEGVEVPGTIIHAHEIPQEQFNLTIKADDPKLLQQKNTWDLGIPKEIAEESGEYQIIATCAGFLIDGSPNGKILILVVKADQAQTPLPGKNIIAGETGGGMSRPEISFRVGTRQESKESVEDLGFEMSEVVDKEIVHQVEAEMGSDHKVWMIDKLKEFSDQWIDEYQAALKQAAENGTQPEARSFSQDVINSDWFKDAMRDKTPEEVKFIEANLRNIDYTMEKKPGVVIQCQPYDTLVEAMLRGEKHMHFMGVAGVFPKDLIPDGLENINQLTTETVYNERFGNWVTVGKTTIDMVKAGDSIVNPVMGDTIEDEQGNKLVTGHMWKIVKVIETTGGPVLLVTSANSDNDGRIINEIVASQAEFDRLFGAEAAIISPSK